MTVAELIEALTDCDQQAYVMVDTCNGWGERIEVEIVNLCPNEERQLVELMY